MDNQKVDSITIEVAENGFTLSYCVKEKQGNGDYNTLYNDRKTIVCESTDSLVKELKDVIKSYTSVSTDNEEAEE